MKASTRLMLGASPEVAWTYFANVMNLERWVEGVSRVHLEGDATARQGMLFTSEYSYGRRTQAVTWEVTAADAPNLLELRWTSGPFSYEGRMAFADGATGTVVEYSVDAGTDGRMTSLTFATMGWLLSRLMRKQLHRNLERARGEIEAGA